MTFYFATPATSRTALPKSAPDKEVRDEGLQHDLEQLPSQLVEVEMGIRLLDCQFKLDEKHQMRIAWNLPQAILDDTTFERALHVLGMPAAFSMKNANIEIDAASDVPKFNIKFDFFHSELHDAKERSSLSINVASKALVNHDLTRYSATSEKLPARLMELKTFRGFASSFQPTQKSRQFTCELKPAQGPPLSLIASFDQDWKIGCSGAPNTQAKNSLAKLVCGSSAILKGLESRCSVSAFDLKTDKTLRFKVTIAIPGEPSFSAALLPEGKLNFEIPTDVEKQVREGTAKLVLKKSTILDVGELTRQIEAEVQKSKIFNQQLKLGNVTCNELGNTFFLELSIGDWQQVKLGPLEVSSFEEVSPAVKALLSEQSIQIAANECWRSRFNHSRYGSSTAKLISLDLSEQTAAVETSILLGAVDQKVPLNVQERVHSGPGGFNSQIRLSDGKSWIENNEVTLANALRPKIEAFCSSLAKSVSDTTGIQLHLTVDDTRGEPWLRLSPPSVSMNAFITLPLPVVDKNAELGFGRVKIDQNGLHFPKTAVVEPRVSVTCSSFTASDPHYRSTLSKEH